MATTAGEVGRHRRAKAPSLPGHLSGLVPQRVKVAPQLVGVDLAVVVGIQELKGPPQLLHLVLARKSLLHARAAPGEWRRQRWAAHRRSSHC